MSFVKYSWREFRLLHNMRFGFGIALCHGASRLGSLGLLNKQSRSSSLHYCLGRTSKRCNRKLFLFAVLNFSVVRDTARTVKTRRRYGSDGWRRLLTASEMLFRENNSWLPCACRLSGSPMLMFNGSSFSSTTSVCSHRGSSVARDFSVAVSC